MTRFWVLSSLMFQVWVAEASTVRFPLPDAPATLDWTAGVTTTEAPIVNQIAEGLFIYEQPSGKLKPAVAESVTKSKDLKEYVFHIRKGLKWSDGRPIYAKDFVDGWLRLISPASTSLYNYYLFDVLNAREYHQQTVSDVSKVGMEARDDLTLVVRLERPIANWESITTFWPLYPIRKDVIEQYGANAWRAGVLPSNGPFTFESIESGKKLVLKRNPNYSMTRKNQVDEIEVIFDSDMASLESRYRSGYYDFLPSVKSALAIKFKKSKDLKHPKIYRNHVLASNAGKFPMNNREFRKAVFLSLDRNRILTRAGFPAKVANNLVPVPIPGSKGSLMPKHNPEAARKALAKSGIVVGNKLKLKILTRIDPVNVSVGKEVQEQIQNGLGINVELSALHERDFALFTNNADYDLILVGWSAKVPVAEDFLKPYAPSASNSRLKFDGREFQQWLDHGRETSDAATALKFFEEAQKNYLQTEYVMAPLLDEVCSVLIHDWMDKLEFNHVGLPVLKDAVKINPAAKSNEKESE